MKEHSPCLTKKETKVPTCKFDMLNLDVNTITGALQVVFSPICFTV